MSVVPQSDSGTIFKKSAYSDIGPAGGGQFSGGASFTSPDGANDHDPLVSLYIRL